GRPWAMQRLLRWSGRRPAPAVGGGLLVLALLATGSVRGADEPPSTPGARPRARPSDRLLEEFMRQNGAREGELRRLPGATRTAAEMRVLLEERARPPRQLEATLGGPGLRTPRPTIAPAPAFPDRPGFPPPSTSPRPAAPEARLGARVAPPGAT